MPDALTCSGCQKRYLWKPQYAGRKVQCRCGQLMQMPLTDPAGPSASAAAPALALEAPPPSIRSSKPGDASATDSAGDKDDAPFELAAIPQDIAKPALPSDAYLQAMGGRPSAVAQALMNREDENTGSPFKEKILPAAVAIVGVIAQVVLWFIFAGSPGRAALGATGMILAQLLVMAPIAVGAVMMVAKMMDISFGPLMPALIRIVAIAVGAGGVADLLFFKVMLSVDFDYQILLVGFVLHMILIGIPVAIIFELEHFEMAAIVAIIVTPRIAILYGMGYLFPHLF